MKASTFELIAASIISIVIGWSFCWLNHPEQKPGPSVEPKITVMCIWPEVFTNENYEYPDTPKGKAMAVADGLSGWASCSITPKVPDYFGMGMMKIGILLDIIATSENLMNYSTAREEMALHGVPVTADVIEWIDGDDITENPPSDLDELAAVDIAWPDIENISIEGTKDWNFDLTRCSDLTKEEMRDLMIWYTFIKQNAPWCDELVNKSIELMVSPKLFEK